MNRQRTRSPLIKTLILLAFSALMFTQSAAAEAFDPAWLALLHMKRHRTGSWASDITAQRFYFAADGRTNPEAELRAEVAAFSAADSDERSVGKNKKCLFPARFKVLNDLNGGHWPEPQNCPQLDEWRAEVHARSATVVYAAQYMASPASLFGHIFIRFDIEPAGRREWHVDSLAHSAGYFAQIPAGSSPLRYVFQGIGGGFAGKWIFSTYAKELNEYSRMEDRDIWEFPLRLTPAELGLMVDHMWELNWASDFDYYFLLHNCAYQLLALIEAAVPRWHVTDMAHGFLAPSDTVRILDRLGAIDETHYRPALGTKLRQEVKKLSFHQRRLWKKIARGEDAAIREAATDVAVLDAASDAIDYRVYASKGQVSDVDLRMQAELLKIRSRLPRTEASEPAVPLEESPLVGHSPSRVNISAGAAGPATNQTADLSIKVRPGLHRVTEGPGYPSGLTLNGFEFKVGYQPTTGALNINQINLVQIENLREFEPVDHAPAWRVLGGWYRPLGDMAAPPPLAFSFKPGIGLAVTDPTRHLRSYVLLEAPYEAQNQLIGGSNAGLGLATGVIFTNQAWPTLRLEFASDEFFANQVVWRQMLKAEINYRLSQNTALTAVFEAQFSAIKSEVGFNFFF